MVTGTMYSNTDLSLSRPCIQTWPSAAPSGLDVTMAPEWVSTGHQISMVPEAARLLDTNMNTDGGPDPDICAALGGNMGHGC